MQRRHPQELHQAATVSPLAAASTPVAVPALWRPASSHHRTSTSTSSVLMQRRHPQELHQEATVPPLAAASTPVAVPALARPRPGVITSPQQRLNMQRSHTAASSPGASSSSRSLSSGSSIHSCVSFSSAAVPRPGVVTSPQQRLNMQRSHAAASSPGASPSSHGLSSGSSIHS